MAILADERVVVDAEHGGVLGYAHPVCVAELDYVVAAVVVCREDANGTLQLLESVGGPEFVAPEAVVPQGFAEGPATVDAPLHHGRVVHEGVGPARADREQVVRRGSSDFLG